MEKQLRKNIIRHMKQTGGIKDYTEKESTIYFKSLL